MNSGIAQPIQPIAQPIGLYVHWPFCEKKCPYCDFNSHLADATHGIDHDRWSDAYVRALTNTMEEFLRHAPAPPVLTSVFFGGGTPSLMAPDTVARILQTVRQYVSFADDAEITLEANPHSADVRRFQGYKRAGVNRLSIGVQSFHDDTLRFLGRLHSATDALHAIEMARAIFPRISFDLLYAFADQSIDSWQDDLQRAVDLGTEHLSLYQLTIESGTPFARNGIKGADEETARTLYRQTDTFMRAAGLPAYEVSNHAKQGAESRHNKLYWQGGQWLGIGPGAHARFLRDGTWQERWQIYDPARWLAQVNAQEHGHGTAKTRVIPTGRRCEETLMNALRLRTGVNKDDFHAATGVALDAYVPAHATHAPVQEGLLVRDEYGLRTTLEGRLVLNRLLWYILERTVAPAVPVSAHDHAHDPAHDHAHHERP